MKKLWKQLYMYEHILFTKIYFMNIVKIKIPKN